MSLIIIRGTADVIRSLDGIAGLLIDRESAHREEELWRVSAQATDAAIVEAQSRGARVDVLMTTEALDRHLGVVMSQIDRGAGGGPSGGG